MKYIWVNPVAAGMYDQTELNKFLSYHGYERFESTINWMEIVREKYFETVKKSDRTVMDMRCPKAVELVKKLDISAEVLFPDIFPILIHCGMEAGVMENLQNEEKVITTPCRALADFGNALGIPKTEFIPWNEFLRRFETAPKATPLEKSPIPPGFFEPLNFKCVSLTGEEEIEKYFAEFQPNKIQLVEMLYCKEGCHNGDGIMS